MSDRRSKQRQALFVRLPIMDEVMGDAEVQDPPTKTALTLWMAGSTAEVGQWIQEGSLPLTEWAAPEKGSYVGFRDTADQAAERHKQRCIKEGKKFQTVCGDPFTTKTPADQYIALRTFLWQKFSTDPKGKDMVPPEGGRAKQLSWDGFWLTKSELNFIVDTVLEAYHHERASLGAI